MKPPLSLVGWIEIASLMTMIRLGVNAFVPLSNRPSGPFLPHQLYQQVSFQPLSATTLVASAPCTLSTPLPKSLSLPSSESESLVAWWYLSLLALLFGTQPFFQKKYVPKTICRSTVVLAQEITKFATAACLLWVSGGWDQSVTGWSMQSWSIHAVIPGSIYVLQNYCTLMAYQNLSPVTFNVLNQTKTLAAALCCYFVIGKPQSRLQVVSLCLLLLSALVIEKVIPISRKKISDDEDTQYSSADRQMHLLSGVLPVLLASFLSGLAGALTQRSVQTTGRNAYLFTMELSVASCLFLIMSLLLNSPDGKRIAQHGFFSG